jgi:hypothetical protein
MMAFISMTTAIAFAVYAWSVPMSSLSLVIGVILTHAFNILHGDALETIISKNVLSRIEFDGFTGKVTITPDELRETLYYSQRHGHSTQIDNIVCGTKNNFFSNSFAFMFIRLPFYTKMFAHREMLAHIKLDEALAESIAKIANKKISARIPVKKEVAANLRNSWMD